MIDDIRFPTAISLKSSGGPERRTEIVALASGAEERNARWAHSRRRYNAGYGLASLADIETVVAFFEERRGRLHGFRWKDHADFKSCGADAAVSRLDQQLGLGDGVTASFQLVKRYGSGLRDYVRTITKPVAGTVVIAVGGAAETHVSVNHATGIVTFDAGFIPGAGAAVTAGFEFDVPARFDTDMLAIDLESFHAGAVPDIPIVELRI